MGSPGLLRDLNALGLLAVTLVLAAALVLQLTLGELPCPLCLLQRVGFVAVGCGLLLNVRFGPAPLHYGLVILGALIKTGAGLLHGFNERIARTMADRGAQMAPAVRPLIAAVAMVIAVYAASSFGLIDLIKNGYRYSSYFFLVVWLLPLLTRGLWLVLRARPDER